MFDQAAARAQLGLAEFLFDGSELFANDGGDALWAGQDVQQVFDFGHHLFVFSDDLVLLQARQALQAHLQDFLRLRVGQAVQAVAAHAQGLVQSIGAEVVGIDRTAVHTAAGQHFAHQFAVPAAGHQRGLGHWRSGGITDDGDEFVDIGQRDRQTFEHMAALARFAQIEDGAAGDDFAAVLQKDLDQVFQVAELGLPIDQGHHIHAEGVLQLRLFVQVVQHHFGYFAALELNYQAHAGLVGFVLDMADAFDFLLVDQLGHAFLQGFFIDLVGQLVHDDGLARAFVDVLEMAFGTHHHLAAPGAVAVFNAIDAVNNARRGEVGRGHDFHQIVYAGIRVAQQMQAGVHHFVQVVRRDIGGHADGNTARAVDQQIRDSGG